MTNTELQEKISALNPNVTFTEEATEFLTIQVAKEEWHDLAIQLKNNPEFHFDYLFCETGMDYGQELGVIYHLRSVDLGHELVVKVNTKAEKLEDDTRGLAYIDTVSDIWRTAEQHEREIHDLFGIRFNNHPNMKVLILPENWEGYPMRKDYDDPVNMIIR
jgi:NADH:ubiquinone oxidoreductase subunit C